ncbi:MAG: GNAT family N-acetyltransferase [Candidatus Eisenbacteria bacterium]
METAEYRRDVYTISTDRRKLQLDLIHEYLSRSSYWALGRSSDVVGTSVEHSLCFGVYEHGRQVGFARMVTDYATFGWLCDVFILDSHRGLGLGKWLIGCVVEYCDGLRIKQLVPATRDAHELYHKYGGFQALPVPEKWMRRAEE